MLGGVLLATATACSGGAGTTAQPTQTQTSAPTASPTTTPPTTTPAAIPAATTDARAATGARPTKVLLIVFENHSGAQALDQMPTLSALATRHGSTTAWQALARPSLPNYLVLAGGSTFGVKDNKGPSEHRLEGPSVFDQAIAAGRTAQGYIEGMPEPCATRDSGRYAVKHNPWPYFADPTSRANCRQHNLPSGTRTAGALHDAVVAGRLPTLGLLVPDMCNSAHDCSLSRADTWLEGWLDTVLAGPDYRTGRLAVVVTFDEDDRRAGNRVLTVVAAPGVRPKVAREPLSHCSWTRYAGELIGAPPLGCARDATSLRAVFGI